MANDKTVFLDIVLRKRWPAIMLVMNRAILERIPLHWGATSMLTFEKWNVIPSLTNETPKMLKIPYAASAEYFWKKDTILSIITLGMGTIKTRNRKGNFILLNAFIP